MMPAKLLPEGTQGSHGEERSRSIRSQGPYPSMARQEVDRAIRNGEVEVCFIVCAPFFRDNRHETIGKHNLNSHK
jgi:hypothetical protein